MSKGITGFLTKHFELVPLVSIVGVAMTGMTGFIVWSCIQKDFIIQRGRYPWDKLDLLCNPYSRKMRQIHEEYDDLCDMDMLYKQMDDEERKRNRRRRSDEC